MSIELQCPGCQKTYRVGEQLAGKKVKCKCGQSLTVPAAEPAVDELEELPFDPLGPAGDPLAGDPLADPLAGDPLGTPPASQVTLSRRPAADPGGEEKGKRKKKRQKAEGGGQEKASKRPKKSKAARKQQQAILLSVILLGVTVGFVVLAVVVLTAMNQPGGASPAEAYKTYQRALRDKKWAEQFAAVAPESQRQMLSRLVSMAGSMEESRPNDSTEIRDFFKQYGRPEGAAGDWWSGVDDKPAFYSDAIQAISQSEENTWPINGAVRTMMRKSLGDIRKRDASAKLVDLQVDGDTASGQKLLMVEGEEHKDPVEFRKVSSRWFVEAADLPPLRGGGFFP